MKFQPGVSGNPNGRPSGTISGRSQALALLDKVLACAETQEKIERALAASVDKDPVQFFRTMIMPLLPREATLNYRPRPTTEWPSLLSKDRPPAAEKSPDDAGGEEPAAQ